MGVFSYLRKNKPLANFLVLLVTMILLLAVAEICFRMNGKYRVYSEKYGGAYSSIFVAQEKNWYHVYPPHTNRMDGNEEFSYSFMANNEGLLEKEFSEAKDSNTIRIMVLGDSFVQGIGAPYDSSCPRNLERLLNTRMDGNKVEIWDCGVGGSDPFFEYVLLKKLMHYHPDYVIVALNSTDINDVYLRGGMERFKPDSTVTYRKPPWFEPLYGKSFLVRRIVHDVLGYNWLFQKPSEQEPARLASIKMIEGVLDNFQNTCTAQHIPLLVSFQPCLAEFQPKERYAMTELMAHCSTASITHFDLKPCMEGAGYSGGKEKPLYWPMDGHFNSKGYLLYAQCLGGAVQESFTKNR